jgi:hypothetical protein
MLTISPRMVSLLSRTSASHPLSSGSRCHFTKTHSDLGVINAVSQESLEANGCIKSIGRSVIFEPTWRRRCMHVTGGGLHLVKVSEE